jgi:CRP-like cAMP-binding protein
MISPELLRRYPFFANLSEQQLVTLAQAASEVSVEPGHYFFRDGDELDHFYLVVEGEAAIVVEVPDQAVEQKVSGQLTGKLQTKDVVVSTIEPAGVFGWSALVPPHKSTASGKATTASRVIVVDAVKLRPVFEEDTAFGYLMMQKAAQVTRARLRDLRIEVLSYLAGEG